MSESRAIPPSVDPGVDPVGTPYGFPLVSPGRHRLFSGGLVSSWRRRRWMRKIEQTTGRMLLSYVSNRPLLLRDDIYNFQRLTAGAEGGVSITLLLASPGGDIDTAELVMQILRDASAGDPTAGDLEIVVPGAAKSAATLLAIGADRILMSRGSELGPIDPQYVETVRGVPMMYSGFDYLRAYDAARRRYRENPEDPANRMALEQFSPARAETMLNDLDRTRQIAERLMSRVNGVNFTRVTATLLDRSRYLSHAQMITLAEANDIGLTQAEHVDPQDPMWLMYWRLYGAQRRAAGSDKKVIESSQQTIVA